MKNICSRSSERVPFAIDFKGNGFYRDLPPALELKKKIANKNKKPYWRKTTFYR